MKNRFSLVVTIMVMFATVAMAQKDEKLGNQQFNVMIDAMNVQLGGKGVDVTKLAMLQSKNADIRENFMKAYTYTVLLSGTFRFIPLDAKDVKTGEFTKEDTTNVRVLKVGELNGTNDGMEAIMYAYDVTTKKFLFVTGYALPVVAQNPKVQPATQQNFAAQVVQAMQGSTTSFSKGADGHDYVTVLDSAGVTTLYDMTAGAMLFSSKPATTTVAVGGPAVTQPFGKTAYVDPNQNGTGTINKTATISKTVTQQGDPELVAQLDGNPNEIDDGPTPAEERLGYFERTYESGLKKFDKDRSTDTWVIRQEDPVKEELIAQDLRRNQAVYIRNSEGKLVRDLDERSRQARLVDGKYNLATGAPTRASEIQEANDGGGFWGGVVSTRVVWNGGYQASRAWNSNGNCYNNGGVVVLNNDSYTGFQTR